MPTLFLVDDEDTFALNAKVFLERQDWTVHLAGSAEDCLARMHGLACDVFLLDYRLPKMSGIALMAQIRERDPDARIVMLTGHGDVEIAVDAMKSGAQDFLTKPVSLAGLLKTLNKLVRERRASAALEYYQSKNLCTLDEILGNSPQINVLKDRVRRIASTELKDQGGIAASVLITGETGVGKELFARACHTEGSRKNGPFVEVNCGAIPQNLLEAELFGYERGAFTDAKERKVGLLEAADGGTVFLDEIAEAPLATQVKLLKVLEEQRLRRLGGIAERKINIRVIAATNQNLDALAKKGQFRTDLLYRLRVITLSVPPLRERAGDATLLANFFLASMSKRYTRPNLAFSTEALNAIDAYEWPGNVRELKNSVEQAVMLSNSPMLSREDMGILFTTEDMSATTSPLMKPLGAMTLPQLERQTLLNAMDACQWNTSQAAKLLGISRDTLRYRIEKFGLERMR